MKMNNIALHAAVVVALGTAPIGGFAVTSTKYAPGTPVTLATERPLGTDATIPFTGSYGITYTESKLNSALVGTGSPLEIRVTLTNGAKFIGTPTPSALTCAYTATLGGDGLGETAAETVIKEADAVVTFKLKAGQLSAVAQCVFTGSVTIGNGSNGGQATYGMSIDSQLKATVPEERVTANLQGDVLKFGQAFGLVASTLGQVTVDVTDPSFSQKFVSGGSVQATGGYLGLLTYDRVSEANAFVITGGAIAAVTDNQTDADELFVANSKVTVILSGTPLQADAGGSNVSVGWGNSEANACSKATNQYVSPNSSGVAEFTVAPASAVDGLHLCYIVDGATRIDKGIVYYEVKATTDSTRAPNVAVSDNTLATFYKNGTSIKILTIPEPTDGNNELNIRIYNMSSSYTMKVYGTLYRPDGTVIGKNALLATVAPNAVKVIKSGGPAPKNMELAGLFSLSTTWGGGRAWLQLEGDSQQMRVQALAKTGGIMVNMSDRVIADGDSFKRPDSQ